MKRVIALFLFGVLILSPLQSFADAGGECDVVLQEEQPSDPNEDSEEIIEIPNRRRLPGRRVMCEISRENGITISQSGISENIVSYEVYDSYGCCVAIFSDEAGFIDFLFSGISGEYILRFKTDNRAYSGMVCL